MSARPIIGITKPDNEDLLAFAALWLGIWLAGGRPRVLTPSTPKYQAAELDGLLLGGGKDVFPGLYNEPAKTAYSYDSARDEMEVFWADRAKTEHIPVLGVCRGAQLMNIICGGNLYASVKEAYEDANYPEGFWHHMLYRKTIEIKRDSLLHHITQHTQLKVNSIHKQAIARLGDGLDINATESNGVIQAISMPDHPFFLGIQFHPEFLLHRPVFRQLFKALVHAARERSA